MPSNEGGYLELADLSGGLNDSAAPTSIRPNECTAATNVDWHHATLARKRGGASAVSLSGYAAANVIYLFTHTPTASLTDKELWAYDITTGGTSNFYRLDNSATWAAVSIAVDTLNTSNAAFIQGVSFNGKFVLAYDSNVDRLHIYDGSSLRRHGLKAPAAAPTVANTGAGSYTATLRYYKVSYVEISGSDYVRRGNLSAQVSFTPSGTGTAARVTKPAAASEGETHWELWGSADGANYFLLATTAVGTTTYDDSAAPSSYSSGTAAPLDGEYNYFPSVKYLLVDEDRLIGAGSWEVAAYASRIWFSPVAGDTDIGDDERTPSTAKRKYYLNIDRGNGGAITGLAGPFYSSVYVFKMGQIHKLVRTGASVSPYQVVTISKNIGALSQRSIILGEMPTDTDSFEDAIYFLDKTGPYRLKRGGIDYLGSKVEEFWSSVTLSESDPPHGIYEPNLKQVWWFVNTSGGRQKMAYHVKTGAWTIHTGREGAARSSAVFATTIGSSMSLQQSAYISWTDGASSFLVYRADGSETSDGATATYQASVTTGDLSFAPPNTLFGIRDMWIMATANAGSQVYVTVTVDYGRETHTGVADLTPDGNETRVIRRVEGVPAITGAQRVAFTIGDNAATANTWKIDALRLFVVPEQQA